MFPITSRYYGLEIAQFTKPDGKTVNYVRRRLIPQPERFELLQEHTVTLGDRLDLIAAQHLGDPEQFWRICDPNRAIDPLELLEPERRLRITLPEGIAGVRDA